MAENNLREVIARMKAQNSQPLANTKAKPLPQPPVEEEMEDPDADVEYNEDDAEEETPEVSAQAKHIPTKTKEIPKTEVLQISDQIRNLQDNGIYRLELLSALHSINQNLNSIAEILVIMAKKGEK